MSHVALENTYTFWTSNMRGDPDVKFLSQFNSIQVFWEQYKVHPVGALPDKTYMHVFKNDIKPLWEDPSNFCGGHFKLTAKSQARSENMWMTVLLNMLGEQFPNSELVNGASVMSNQVGNNLVKVWLATTDKSKVQATREFLRSILDPADYMPNVTFVPHKLVVKGAGKKVSSSITEANPRALAAAPDITTESSPTPSERRWSGSSGRRSSGSERRWSGSERRWSGSADGMDGMVGMVDPRMMQNGLLLPGPMGEGFWPCPCQAPRSPESAWSFGGALSSLPSSQCSEYASMPPSPRPVSPAASYTGSEWEADCAGMRLMPPSPFPTHLYAQGKHRHMSVTSQDGAYTHNPYSLANAVVYNP